MRKYLLELGFKKKWSSDKSGSWYRLNIPHKLIHKLHITIELDRKSITVWCEEPVILNGRLDTNYVLIYKKLTRLNLNKILSFLSHQLK